MQSSFVFRPQPCAAPRTTTLGLFDRIPPNLRYRIFELAICGEVEVKVDDAGLPAPSQCPSLQLCHQLRTEILREYLYESSTFVFLRPLALSRFLNRIDLSGRDQHQPQLRSIRLVLLDALATLNLTGEEQHGDTEGPHVAPLFKAWMDSFRILPSSLRTVQVDLTHSFQMRTTGVARLVQHLSTTLWLRTGKRVRFYILGCSTDEGKAFVESSTVGAVRGGDEGSGNEVERRRLVIGAE